MTWLEGESILWAKDQDLDFRQTVGHNLFYAWYYPFYTQGIIHADPHFGNYSIKKNGNVNIFDFGCVRQFDSSFINNPNNGVNQDNKKIITIKEKKTSNKRLKYST